MTHAFSVRSAGLVLLLLMIETLIVNAREGSLREASYRRPNVLVIMADDFKPIVSSYGSPLLSRQGTKNIDRLVSNGISFMNAHAQMSFCGPSRASFLTSLRPDSVKVYDITPSNDMSRKIRATRKTKEALTIPKLFKLAGYETYGIGKIFHENEYDLMERSDTWTTPVFTWINGKARKPSFPSPYQGTWISAPDVDDDFFPDGQAARMASNLITDKLAPNAAARDAPWFLAIGFWKPHLPWSAPGKYFDMCEPPEHFHGTFSLKTPANVHAKNFNFAKGLGCGETREYKGPFRLNSKSALDSLQRANRAYHATTLYMDAQVGRVLDALESSSSRDNTIVVFFGDHGSHLGDKGLYCKHTNYEQAVKVPLIVVPPRRDRAKYGGGSKSYAPVELLDLMPTLNDLAGLDMDVSKYRKWEGVSLVPILRNPQHASVKQAAVSQYFRGLGSERVWGYTIRTTRYRYTNWQGRFEELYDLLEDEWETVSLHTNAELKRSIIENGYYAGENFGRGAGKQPFDFADRGRMENKPSPRYA